jgi:hypothetical protein
MTSAAKPWYAYEYLFDRNGKRVGAWVPANHACEMGCPARERPDGLRHLLNADELIEARRAAKCR